VAFEAAAFLLALCVVGLSSEARQLVADSLELEEHCRGNVWDANVGCSICPYELNVCPSGDFVDPGSPSGVEGRGILTLCEVE
jgi:hypothetical protein